MSERLERFFTRLVSRSFWDLGIRDPDLIGYIVKVLVEFARTDKLYQIRHLKGKRLGTLVEMLAHREDIKKLERGSSRFWEYWLSKRIGDFALFMTGLFQEYLRRWGFYEFYLESGKNSYIYASEIKPTFEYPPEKLLYELGRNFELYHSALYYMKKAYWGRGDEIDPFSEFASHLRWLM